MRERWARTGKSAAANRVAAGYALLATLATALALGLREGVPWVYPDPWFPAPPVVALTTSAVLGLALAVAIVFLTRVAVTRFAWAQQLHAELRPVARDLGLGQILIVAGLSSLGEELLFRGLLVPWLGVIISAALFGLAHQIRGPSRWVWIGWATVMGAALGAIFAATGSLVGPLIAHAVINAVNLTYLRDHDPAY
jgi:membrane protease YdiL (CAAX protease family)